MRCEPVGEPLLSVILATFTAHLVLNNLHQVLNCSGFPSGFERSKRRKEL